MLLWLEKAMRNGITNGSFGSLPVLSPSSNSNPLLDHATEPCLS